VFRIEGVVMTKAGTMKLRKKMENLAMAIN
jgi:hypothetical protein